MAPTPTGQLARTAHQRALTLLGAIVFEALVNGGLSVTGPLTGSALSSWFTLLQPVASILVPLLLVSWYWPASRLAQTCGRPASLGLGRLLLVGTIVLPVLAQVLLRGIARSPGGAAYPDGASVVSLVLRCFVFACLFLPLAWLHRASDPDVLPSPTVSVEDPAAHFRAPSRRVEPVLQRIPRVSFLVWALLFVLGGLVYPIIATVLAGPSSRGLVRPTLASSVVQLALYFWVVWVLDARLRQLVARLPADPAPSS